MKTFTAWAEENKLDLPQVDENTKRGGIAYHAYPSAYAGRGHAYPDSYFMPAAADALFKMQKKPNDKAPSDNAP